MKLRDFILLLVMIGAYLYASGSIAATDTSSSGIKPAEAPQPKTCESFKDFKEAYEYFKKQKEIPIPETKAIRYAIQISKGCTGSAKRFIQVFETLNNSGVLMSKSFSLAMDFAHDTDARTQNFANVFKRIFLENYFDFDFETAYKISVALSKQQEYALDEVRTDFVNLTKFCIDKDQVDLPVKTCAEISLGLCKFTHLYPKTGLYPAFKDLFTYLKNHEKLGLSTKEALKVIPQVLEYGPKSVENFKGAFEYAASKEINVSAKNSLKIAMMVAKGSLDPNE